MTCSIFEEKTNLFIYLGRVHTNGVFFAIGKVVAIKYLFDID